eukprot:1151162-Pelagomonas_calceolata.AAC.2
MNRFVTASRTNFQSDAVLKLPALLVETRKHLLLQLSCRCRQCFMLTPFRSQPSRGNPTASWK